jgi:metal-responsive CopG/Arc/MetJ family transcriptional regulator
MAKVKTHFVFPEELLKDIDRIVGNRKRSHFVVEATKEKLERERLKKAFKDIKGLWKKEDHPEFSVKEDIEKWVSNLRKRDLK